MHRSSPFRAFLVVAFGLSLLVAPLTACSTTGDRIQSRPPGSGGGAHDGDHDAEATRVVRYDEPFELGYGQAVAVERSDTRARFVELVEDSRCPANVQCIQAGRARVRLVVTRGGTAPVSIELSTDRDGSLRSAGGVTWELQAVAPYPSAGVERRPADYTLTMVARPLR